MIDNYNSYSIKIYHFKVYNSVAFRISTNLCNHCDNQFFNVFLFKNLFIYLFLAALGLCFCAWAFSSCGDRGLLFVAVHGLLIVVASLVTEHGL